MNKDVNLGRIDMIWEVLYNSYVKNFDKFDEYESEYLMKNFNKAYILDLKKLHIIQIILIMNML